MRNFRLLYEISSTYSNFSQLLYEGQKKGGNFSFHFPTRMAR